MKYEVRYQLGGDEHTILVDAEDAASAAELAQSHDPDSQEVFELIQVHFLEDGHSAENFGAPSQKQS